MVPSYGEENNVAETVKVFGAALPASVRMTEMLDAFRYGLSQAGSLRHSNRKLEAYATNANAAIENW